MQVAPHTAQLLPQSRRQCAHTLRGRCCDVSQCRRECMRARAQPMWECTSGSREPVGGGRDGRRARAGGGTAADVRRHRRTAGAGSKLEARGLVWRSLYGERVRNALYMIEL